MKATRVRIKDPDRRKYVSKVRRFALSKAGLKKIRRLAPQIAEMIENHPEYLYIPQFEDDPRLAGNYYVKILGEWANFGETGNLVFRLCEHIYNYCTSADYFGTVDKPSIPAEFKAFAWGNTHKEMREIVESNVIEKYHPYTQWTDPDSPEYGSDKPIPEGETRETMRPDICVYPYLRRERFLAIQDAYNKEHGA